MIGTTFYNRYKIIKHLGAGGFANVYLAKDTKTNVEVALKVYNTLDEYGVKIFQQEYAKLVNLNHQHILKANYFDVSEHQPFLIMPYCKGGSLTKLLVNPEPDLSEKRIAELLFQISDGLTYLHSKGVVHRDLKPDNILFKDESDVLISDFGVSQRMNSTLSKSVKATAANMSSGYTPAYAPPSREVNQVRPKPSFDIFSLGVVLYELATKELPYLQTGKAVEAGDPIPELPTPYTKRLSRLIQLCLDKDPEKRPTASQLKKWAAHFMEQHHWPNVLDGSLPKKPVAKRGDKGKHVTSNEDSKIKIEKKHWLIGAAILVMGISTWAFWPGDANDASSTSTLEENPIEEINNSDASDWANAVMINSIDSYKEYIANHPQGVNVDQAKNNIIEFETLAKDEYDWQTAKNTNTIKAYQNYLSEHSQGKYADQAFYKISELESMGEDENDWQTAKNTNTIKGYQNYISAHQTGQFVNEARNRINNIRAALANAEEEKKSSVTSNFVASIDYRDWFLKTYNTESKVRSLGEQAKGGNIIAQRRLGRYYKAKWDDDCEKALYWFKKAADQGDGFSQAMIGFIYSGNSDCYGFENTSLSKKYFDMALKQNKIPEWPRRYIAYSISHLYEYGTSEEKNWLQKACDWGQKNACEDLEDY